MKSTKTRRATGLVRRSICLGLYGLALLPFTTQAASTATVTVTATFVAATCDITVPATVWLGTLTPGVPKQHSEININWTCDGTAPVSTGLKAIPIAGNLNSGGDSTKLEMLVGGARSNTQLWLENASDSGGGIIKLTGLDADIFCGGTEVGARVCKLRPVTQVGTGPGTVFGIANASIRFEIAYL